MKNRIWRQEIWSVLLVGMLTCAVGCGGDDDLVDSEQEESADAATDVVDAADVDDAGDVDDAADVSDAGDASDAEGEDTDLSESCDGTDTDGDGVVDEGCPCDFDGHDEGVCAASVISEATGDCEEPDAYEVNEESCDGLDNDCDGTIDPGCSCNYAGLDEGVCAEAMIDTESGQCAEPEDYEADEESCDGLDNDCDGAVDPGCPCDYEGTSEGVCGDGVMDRVGSCSQPPEFEVDERSCDGLDNDCDGSVDEGCPCDYNGTSEGVCSEAVLGGDGGECSEPANYEADEVTCDGADNDCDGVVDEGCPCDYNGTDDGVCSNGVLEENGQCGEPTDYEADESTCDGLDNDCDGFVDETGDIFEDFEGSASGWYTYTDGTGSINSDTSATDKVYSGSYSGKAWGSNGACGIGGLAKDFTLSDTPNSISMQVRATSDAWGRVTILLLDSNGDHKLYEEKGSGSSLNIGWTEKTFDISSYESDFTLVIGNADDSQHCSNFDHTWDIWVDDITVTQTCSSS